MLGKPVQVFSLFLFYKLLPLPFLELCQLLPHHSDALRLLEVHFLHRFPRILALRPDHLVQIQVQTFAGANGLLFLVLC